MLYVIFFTLFIYISLFIKVNPVVMTLTMFMVPFYHQNKL